MKVSIIIPAYNEEKELPICLEYVQRVLDEIKNDRPSLQWELIVTDNNSTDKTAEVARAAGAEVVFEPVNQIARARNAGTKIATGDWFLFIDADSRLHVDSIREMLEAIEAGNVGGGGCLIRMDDVPFWGRCSIKCWNLLSRTMSWAAGSFVYCRADGFRAIEGFNEDYYAAEELDFSKRLRAWGKQQGLRFRVLTRQAHASSSRKFHIYSNREIFKLFRRVVFSYGSTVRSQRALDFFYDGRR